MNEDQNTGAPAAPIEPTMTARIFGIGGAGLNVLDNIIRAKLPGVTPIAVSTRPRTGAAEELRLESKMLRSLGTGGDPERGRAIAEENLTKLKAACEGASVVFVVAGLGGGSGSGISPVLARVARETGALVLAFVTLPFECEGNRRQHQALQGLHRLNAEVDGVVCLPNQKILHLIDDQTSVADTFKLTNELLADGLAGIWRLLSHNGLIQVHFDDLCAILRDRHSENAFATAQAEGPTRSRDIVDRLLAHPLLDGGKTLSESDAVLVSIIGGPDLSMAEVNRVVGELTAKCPRAQFAMGAAIDDAFKDRIALTVIASRRGEATYTADRDEDADTSEGGADRLKDQLLDPSADSRRQSRFVPPAPSLPPEKIEKLIAQGSGRSRPRKSASKMRQGQLPLEIVSKGRFDKSEPTIYKGEDLDVPTYIRRGMSLN